jgi:hypothetical protein
MRHLALPVLASAQLAAPAPNSVIVFRDVTVIPMTQAAPLLRKHLVRGAGGPVP